VTHVDPSAGSGREAAIGKKFRYGGEKLQEVCNLDPKEKEGRLPEKKQSLRQKGKSLIEKI